MQAIRGHLARLAIAAVLVVVAGYFLIPLVWLVLAPTKTHIQLSNDFPLAFGSFGHVAASWDRLISYQNGALLTWLKNSVVYTGLGVLLAVIGCIGAGYGISTYEFRGRRLLLWMTLGSMLMPGTVLVLPIFLELNRFNLVDTIWAVILPSAFFPFGVYLMYLYFRSVMTKDLAAAARLDGCSELQLFFRVALPLAGPMAALIAFFTFVGQWNNYFLPLLVLPTSGMYPLPVGLAMLAGSDPSLDPGQYSAISIYNPEVAFAAILAMLPVLVALLFAQRVVMRGAGVMSGGFAG